MKAIAGLLEEKASIPMVHEQMPLIQEIQTDEWWQDVTTPHAGKSAARLRALVKLIEKQQRKPIYTDFEDEMGAEAAVELPGFASPDYERFRAKARQFLQAQKDEPIRKLRWNEPLTASDLAELEPMLVENLGTSGDQDAQRARTTALASSCAHLSGSTGRPRRTRSTSS